jgi:hypothetical protein
LEIKWYEKRFMNLILIWFVFLKGFVTVEINSCELGWEDFFPSGLGHFHCVLGEDF